MIKKEILSLANENVVIKETPPPKKPRKKANQKVKLSSLLEELLLEAVDLSSGEKVIKALERGQIPGVKKKVFLNTSFSSQNIIDSLNDILEKVKNRVEDRDFNNYTLLLLKRSGNIEKLDQFTDDDLSIIFDAMTAYFSNRNKKEAKEDETVKKRFNAYVNSEIDLAKDKNFEKWAIEKFVEKAKAKEDDIEEIYSDAEGWKVLVARTFPEAKKLACMGDRKAKWCTAASSGFFNNYASKEHPLYIIRNENKNVMFQMDFGKGRTRSPNFKNEKDQSATIDEIKAAGIPNDLLKSIKAPEGKSVFDIIEPIMHGVTPLADTSSTPENQLEGWSEHVFSNLEEFLQEIENYTAPTIFSGDKTIEDYLRGGEEKTIAIKKIIRLSKGKKIVYCIIPNYSITIVHGGTKRMTNFALVVTGNKLVLKTAKSIVESDLPNAIKKKLFTVISRDFVKRDLVDKEESIEQKDFEKSNNIQDLGNGFVTGVKTFADIVSLKLGEILIEKIKRKIMSKSLNLDDVILIRVSKRGKDLVASFVLKDGSVVDFLKNDNFGRRFFLSSGFPDDIKRFIGSKVNIRGDTKLKQMVKTIIANLDKEIVFEKKFTENTSAYVKKSGNNFNYRFSSRDKDVWKASQIAREIIENDGEEVFREVLEYEKRFYDLFFNSFYTGR